MFKVGDRVWYKDAGPEDTGRIVGIIFDEQENMLFTVEWDGGNFEEKVDHFRPEQLELIS